MPISRHRSAGNEYWVSDGVATGTFVIVERAVWYGIDCPPARQYFSASPSVPDSLNGADPRASSQASNDPSHSRTVLAIPI